MMKVDKKQIVRMLEEMAVLLELQGANMFKVRAFANAARALQSLSEDISLYIKGGQIVGIKGVGKSISDLIMEFMESGTAVDLENLRTATPAGLLELLRIQGMGPKKIKAVWDKLNVTTVGELEYACVENRLVDLEGFGEKTQAKILLGIEMLKKYSERHLLSETWEHAESILVEIKKMPGLIRCEIAGSLRRWRETVKDIDILASAKDADRDEIMSRFTGLPLVETVTGQGNTKSSVVLNNGVNADLRIVSDSQFPYALQHFTGSKDHNVAMREYARKRDLKMNEYGLFKNETENISCSSESDIYRELGMQLIPPELREDQGEIQAALENRIPDLVELSDLKGMIHCHTHYSDGANSIRELAEACKQKGYQYLLISDHSKSAMYANGLSEERVRQQHQEIDEFNKEAGSFRVLKSIECDILWEGNLDYPDEVLQTFDLVIASIHSRFKMTEEEGTNRLIKAMQNPYVTIIGHPTGRLLLGREGYPVNLDKVIDAAAGQGVALEINANPHRLDLDWRFLRRAKEKGVKISIGPDAHQIPGLDDMKYGVGIARKGWLTKENILNYLTADEVLRFSKSRRRNQR